MKKVPKVLIMGRPNVGKSTLINRICATRKAITSEVSGVTRDIKMLPATWNGKEFMVLDSGGMMLDRRAENIQKRIDAIVKEAIEHASKIVFLVDLMQGLNPLDEDIAQLLRHYQDKVILVVNKVDNLQRRNEIATFFKLGFSEPIPISALQGLGVGDLLDKIVENINHSENVEELYKSTFRISIVGRPNVGKSSLLNALVNEERVIVDDKAGTTRDAIEVYFEAQGNKYLFVDTAGIRRRAKIKDSIEYYSVLRADNSIKYSDLVILVLDAQELVNDLEKKIIGFILENKRNMFVFVNKWDLCDRTDIVRKDMIRMCENDLPTLHFYPFIFGSATQKVGLGKIFAMIPEIIQRSNIRIPTAELNRFVEEVILRNPPKAKEGKRIKIFYATQAETGPPTFVFFVNEPKLATTEYRRFIEKRLREFLGGFEGCAMRIKFKARERRDFRV